MDFLIMESVNTKVLAIKELGIGKNIDKDKIELLR